MDRLEQALARARRHKRQVALLCAKPAPDSTAPSTLVRECDSVTWLGDELLVLCGELDGADAATAVAQRTAETLGEGVSIGMAVSADGCDHAEHLLKGARAAMERADGSVDAADELTRRRLGRRRFS